MPKYPYYNEPIHNLGGITDVSGNGARSTATSLAEGRLVVDAIDKVFMLDPTQNPLTALLTNIGKGGPKGMGLLKRSTTQPKFTWFEKQPAGRYCKASGIYAAAGALTLSVTGSGTSPAYIFTPGDILMNSRTGERMLVGAIAGVSTLTIAAAGRAFGSTSATAGADGDGLFIIGNVNEENSGARNINQTRSSEEYNLTQIFKTTIGASGSENASKLYGGKSLPQLREEKGKEHALDVERAFWFGERKETTGTQGKPIRATGGIQEYIEAGNSYVQNQGGLLTAPDFETFLREGFSFGPKQKYFVCGSIVLQAINEIARGHLTTRMDEHSYGMTIVEWQSAFGKINIVHNPLFVEELAGTGYLLDMDCFAYRFMEGRDTKLSLNIQANDLDGEVDEYLTEVGLERKQAQNCAMIKGIE